MIRTALTYLIADVCIDRLFDPIEKALSGPPELRSGMMLKWFRYGRAVDVLVIHVLIVGITSSSVTIRMFDGESTCYENGTPVDFGDSQNIPIPLCLIKGWGI